MKMINTSPYDTRVLRSIALRIYKRILAQAGSKEMWWWKNLRVFAYTGKMRQRPHLNASWRPLYLRLPKLNGSEWVWLKRQESGEQLPEDLGRRPNAPLIRDRVVALLIEEFDLLVPKKVRIDSSKVWRGIPRVIPLKPVPVERPRDPVRERYARVLKNERAWQRKAKLAATKLRHYRNKRRYYERRMAT